MESVIWSFGFSDKKDSQEDKAVGEPIVIINAEIAKAKNVKNNDADAQYEAGIILSNKTRVPLGTIKSLLGTNDIQYQTVADNLAKQILQCGINYYNNSEEPDSAIKAMPLQEYALQIAVGTLTKDRCKKNVDILQKIVAELPPKKIWEDDKKIKQELQLFSDCGKSIMAAINLLQNCKKAILNIESKLGANNVYFIEISNLLLEMALQEIIREVNEIQRKAPKNPILGFEYLSANEQQIFLQKRSAWIEEMKVVIPKAWTLMLLMEQFTMNKEFKEKRFLPNKSLLRDMSVSLNLHTSAFSFLNSLSSTRCLLWLIILTSLFLVYLSFQIK